MKATSASFFSAQKGKIDHSTAIVPLITKQKNTENIEFIGTAFYITSGGLLMTAKHNLFGKDGKLFANIAILHFHDKEFIVRQISRCCYSNSYDIAYLLPWMKLNNKGMSKTQTLSLTTNLPNRDDQLALYGYPDTKLEYDSVATTIDMNPEFYLGSFVEFHKNGFGLLRNPCFKLA